MEKNTNSMSLLSFLMIVVALVYGLSFLSQRSTIDNAIALEKNIKKAAAACYAVEGAYPQSIDYLTTHYGLILDEKKYVVHYEGVGGNLMPSIAVVPKGTYYFENEWSK
ncbi:MAG: hypothetical protein Q4D77_05045 [Peptostreptococcaceae bacterium]|nr:hypothetical protein [Peptostreptococcaceae bacterium]